MATSAERMRRLRARQAAAIEPADGGGLRDAAVLLAPAVGQSIGALGLDDRDAAAAQLALRYAAAIDEASSPAAALRHLGPLLLKSLEALRATPAARRPARKPDPGQPNWLQEMRRSRSVSDVSRRHA